MTQIELLACQHLDECVSAGEFDSNTGLAIQKVLSIIKDREAKLKIAVEAIKHNHWWGLKVIRLNTICDGCIALKKIRGEK
jgi:hypothetical protein